MSDEARSIAIGYLTDKQLVIMRVRLSNGLYVDFMFDYDIAFEMADRLNLSGCAMKKDLGENVIPMEGAKGYNNCHGPRSLFQFKTQDKDSEDI